MEQLFQPSDALAQLNGLIDGVDRSASNATKWKPVEEWIASKLGPASIERVKVKWIAGPSVIQNRLGEGGFKTAMDLAVAVLGEDIDVTKEGEKFKNFLRSREDVGALLLVGPQDGHWVPLNLFVGALGQSGARAIEALFDIPAVRMHSAQRTGLPQETTLPELEDRTAWVEFTHAKNRTTAAGYRFGEVLWSPSRDAGGADNYASMREAKPGDIVIHVMDRNILGFSIVHEFREQTEEPPHAGTWAGMSPYYVISLTGFRPFSTPTELSGFLTANAAAIRADMEPERPLRYPFLDSGKGWLQASLRGYLYKCTPRLYELFRHALGTASTAADYGIDDAMQGLFLDERSFSRMIDAMRAGRNLILQGPPGVGKTFVARRLAYAFLGSRDDARVERVQFHPSFSYEDFVEGIRPTDDGRFETRPGIFRDFIERHQSTDPTVFIIDELNRGNLPKIFGELLSLIEPDKRSREYAARLPYSHERFHIPPHLHLLGLMNTADRSLAMVDYALRRRFSFFDIRPHFGAAFSTHLVSAGVPEDLVTRIQERMTILNAEIREDRENLGPGFEIGHSFFCAAPSRAADPEHWYEEIIRRDIEPLLREYWFDDPEKCDSQVQALMR